MFRKQPNSWSCFPTAFSYILGIDIVDLIKILGHDGSEKIWPQFNPPRCYRSWHIQELVKASLSLGYAVIQIDRVMCSAPSPNVQDYINPDIEYFYWTIANSTGVLPVRTQKGEGHALAYNRNVLYDPATGHTTKIDNFTMLDSIYRIERIVKN